VVPPSYWSRDFLARTRRQRRRRSVRATYAVAFITAIVCAGCGSSVRVVTHHVAHVSVPSTTASASSSVLTASEQTCLRALPGFRSVAGDDATAPALGQEPSEAAAVQFSYPADPPLPSSKPVLHVLVGANASTWSDQAIAKDVWAQIMSNNETLLVDPGPAYVPASTLTAAAACFGGAPADQMNVTLHAQNANQSAKVQAVAACLNRSGALNQPMDIQAGPNDPDSWFLAPDSTGGPTADIALMRVETNLKGGGGANIFVYRTPGLAREYYDQIKQLAANGGTNPEGNDSSWTITSYGVNQMATAVVYNAGPTESPSKAATELVIACLTAGGA
jgi:hypothetical protein